MEQLAVEAATFGLHLSTVQLEQFAHYQAMLIDWSERLNLTSIRTPEAIQRRHFLDSLSCAIVTGELTGSSLIDIGTGAGFPGIPLKILYPGLSLVLVESIAKKTRFLEAVVDELRLEDVTIIAERAEILGQQAEHRSRYDWAVARAVAEMRVLVEYLLPLCRPGGHILAQKGESAPAETAAAATAIKRLGGTPAQLHPIQLPDIPKLHYLVVVKKENETPSLYPRRPGIPSKRPL